MQIFVTTKFCMASTVIFEKGRLGFWGEIHIFTCMPTISKWELHISTFIAIPIVPIGCLIVHLAFCTSIDPHF